MKRLSITLALILCFILCVFAFASCGKKKAETTTAAQTDPEGSVATTAEPTLSPATTTKKQHAHVPEPDYTVDLQPTCTTPGEKSYYCTECGLKIPGTTVPIDVVPTAHKVLEWDTDAPTLLKPTGSRSGICAYCQAPVQEDLTFEHDVQTLTTSSGKYTAGYATLGEIRGDDHFYPTDASPEGNDLLVEYSLLWNETLLNLYNTNDVMPAVDTRITTSSSGTSGNMGIARLELANDTTSQWCICKFAGGMTGYGTPEGDSPYSRFTTTVNDVTAYPNIGGANPGDGQPHGETQWGWHRISVRFREEVTNVDAVKGGATATYYIQMWVYIDGDLVFHNSGTDHRKDSDGTDRKLYSAAPDGEGGIAYTENDHLYLHGAFLDSKRMKDGKGYFEIADYSSTIGSDFVQNVKKVSDPTPATLEVEDGVSLPSTMWYELAD